VRTWSPLVVLVLIAAAFPAAAGARTIHVGPGESIQAAVDAAEPGDTVKVRPGTYTEAGRPCPMQPGNTCAVVVTEDDIRLVAQSAPEKPVVLRGAGGQDEGIGVGRTADPACLSDPSKRVHGSLVSGFTVEGFEEDGVFLVLRAGLAHHGHDRSGQP
jgi:nitrous oxidase accessory protein NosD